MQMSVCGGIGSRLRGKDLRRCDIMLHHCTVRTIFESIE